MVNSFTQGVAKFFPPWPPDGIVPGEALFRVSTAFAVGTAAAVPLLGLALTRRGRQG